MKYRSYFILKILRWEFWLPIRIKTLEALGDPRFKFIHFDVQCQISCYLVSMLIEVHSME